MGEGRRFVEETVFVKGYEAGGNRWVIQPVWPVAVPRPESSELNHPVPCPTAPVFERVSFS